MSDPAGADPGDFEWGDDEWGDDEWSGQPQCPWTIRWIPYCTTRCDLPVHIAGGQEGQHEGPGLGEGERIFWYSGDRREYTGQWPGYCDKLGKPPFEGGCALPAGHRGRCAH